MARVFLIVDILEIGTFHSQASELGKELALFSFRFLIYWTGGLAASAPAAATAPASITNVLLLGHPAIYTGLAEPARFALLPVVILSGGLSSRKPNLQMEVAIDKTKRRVERQVTLLPGILGILGIFGLFCLDFLVITSLYSVCQTFLQLNQAAMLDQAADELVA